MRAQALGDDLLESIINDNIPIYTEQEKYNQCVTSVLDRVEAQLKGNPVPGEEGERACAGNRNMLLRERRHS